MQVLTIVRLGYRSRKCIASFHSVLFITNGSPMAGKMERPPAKFFGIYNPKDAFLRPFSPILCNFPPFFFPLFHFFPLTLNFLDFSPATISLPPPPPPFHIILHYTYPKYPCLFVKSALIFRGSHGKMSTESCGDFRYT